MFGSPKEWPCPVIPLAVNVVQYPPPTGHRCFMLGKAIRKAVDFVPRGPEGRDLRHRRHVAPDFSGPRAGLINSKFDKAFLDGLTKNPKKLAAHAAHRIHARGRRRGHRDGDVARHARRARRQGEGGLPLLHRAGLEHRGRAHHPGERREDRAKKAAARSRAEEEGARPARKAA